MKANELRIGNLFKTDEIVFVYSIEFNDKTGEHRVCVDNLNKNYKDCLFLDEINAIPLTNEWLDKFRFEKGLKTKSGWYNYGLNVKEQGVNFFVAHRVCIKYVHQLQNLYFALTSEELKTY